MKDIDYSTAVARIKINETRLLGTDGIEKLINSKSLDEAVSLLNEKGYSSQGAPIDNLFDNQLENAWQLVSEVAPDFSEFNFMLVKNDFHNFKAVLKGVILDKSYEDLCIYPVITPVEVLHQAISEQRWGLLPDYMQSCAKKSYDYFVSTNNGQLSDLCLDKGALNACVELSKSNKDEFIRGLGDLIASTYNLRIAVRSAKLNMQYEMIKEALCDNCSLDSNELALSASKDLDEVKAFIAKGRFSSAAAELEKSFGSFEKWCDDALIRYCEKARYVCFTAAPLAAYIIKKEAELKCVRIIISGKQTGMSEEQIRLLLRSVY